jgi:hypothetical protein
MSDRSLDVEHPMHPRFLLALTVAVGLGACFTPRDFIECAERRRR